MMTRLAAALEQHCVHDSLPCDFPSYGVIFPSVHKFEHIVHCCQNKIMKVWRTNFQKTLTRLLPLPSSSSASYSVLPILITRRQAAGFKNERFAAYFGFVCLQISWFLLLALLYWGESFSFFLQVNLLQGDWAKNYSAVICLCRIGAVCVWVWGTKQLSNYLPH